MKKLFDQKLAARACFSLLAAAAGCGKHEAVAASAVTGLEIAPCATGFEADCGEMLVYENRQTKSGRIIPIRFIRVHAKSENPEKDVVVHLTGGPGGEAIRKAAETIKAARTLDRHDLIIVDQRGAGRSHPLDCVKYDLENDPDAFQEMFEVAYFDAGRFRECKDHLSAIADLAQYTTSIIADDINDLRNALGYEQMTLMGASYGSTLGLEIIRRHAAHVRAAVLRGVIPPSINQTETIAKDMEDALQALFRDCAADERCRKAFPTFEQDFRDVLARFAASRIEIELPHPATKAPTKVRVGYDELTIALRYTLYSTQFSAALPLAMSEAKKGDYTKLMQVLPGALLQVSSSVFEGMWASVRCAEEFPFLDEERARRMAQGTVLGTNRLDTGKAICAFWPRGAAAPDFHDPVKSDVPVLMIDASLDAATPPWMAQETAGHLTSLKLIVIPNRSHFGLGGGCIEDIVKDFVDEPDVASVDDACVRDFKRPPFVLPKS